MINANPTPTSQKWGSCAQILPHGFAVFQLATLGERRMWICPEYSRNTSTQRQQVSEHTSTKREQVPVACTTPRRPTTNGVGRCPRGFTRLRVVLVYDPKRALCLRLDYSGCAAQPWSLEFAAFRVVSQHARQRTNVHTHSIVSIRSLSHFGPTRRTHETDATNSLRLHRPTWGSSYTSNRRMNSKDGMTCPFKPR